MQIEPGDGSLNATTVTSMQTKIKYGGAKDDLVYPVGANGESDYVKFTALKYVPKLSTASGTFGSSYNKGTPENWYNFQFKAAFKILMQLVGMKIL